MTEAAVRRTGGAVLLGLIAAAIGGFAICVTLFWVGFLGSDDMLYWAAAGGWRAHVPFLGTTHWALRHTLVIPMALTRALWGDGQMALLSPSLLYAGGGIALAAIWIARAAGPLAAAAGLALIVTCPQFVLLSSTANVDVVEVFFILLGFLLIQRAMEPATTPRSRAVLALLAGAALGFALLSRETAAFAMVALGLLFLAGYGMRRGPYVLIGIGFGAVAGLEFLWLWWMSGDLFYRSRIALDHDAFTNRWLSPGAGVPLVHPLIDPVTMLLFNHVFGLLTWIGVPLAVWLMRRATLSPPERRLAVLALTLAVTWTVIAAGLWTELSLIPRYYLLPALLLSLVSGLALARLWGNGRRRLAGGLFAALIAANLVGMWVDNRNYMYGEHVLVEIAARTPGIIHTDPLTIRRARLLLDWDGTLDRVSPYPPGPGDLFFFNPARDTLTPDADWRVVERHGLGATWGQVVASHVLPPRLLSRSLYQKLGRGHPDVVLYAVP